MEPQDRREREKIAEWYFNNHTSSPPTAEETERGIKSPDAFIRCRFLQCKDINLTKDQINIAINDISSHVRAAAIIRNDCILNQAQINLLLEDKSPLVRLKIMESPNIVLTRSQMTQILKREPAL